MSLLFYLLHKSAFPCIQTLECHVLSQRVPGCSQLVLMAHQVVMAFQFLQHSFLYVMRCALFSARVCRRHHKSSTIISCQCRPSDYVAIAFRLEQEQEVTVSEHPFWKIRWRNVDQKNVDCLVQTASRFTVNNAGITPGWEESQVVALMMTGPADMIDVFNNLRLLFLFRVLQDLLLLRSASYYDACRHRPHHMVRQSKQSEQTGWPKISAAALILRQRLDRRPRAEALPQRGPTLPRGDHLLSLSPAK